MEQILYSLSEISLLGGIIVLWLGHIWGNHSVNSYFRTAKSALLLSICFGVIFYNKMPFPEYYVSSSYTIMLFVICGLAAFIWLSLTFRWFTAMDIPAYYFCSLALLMVLFCKIIVCACNLGVLFVGLLGLAIVNYLFLRFSQETEEFHKISSRYGACVIFFSIFMLISLVFLTPLNWNYQDVGAFLSGADTIIVLPLIMGILFFILFMLAVAPFHFWFTDIIAPAVLPVAAGMSIVPFAALWGAFLNVNLSVLSGFDEQRYKFYTVLGIMSVLLGAVGTHSSRNIKKIFAYVALYSNGVLLLIFASFSENAILSGFIYMQAYLPAIIGIYTCFYSFKSHREYLNNLSMLSGIASVRPYISGAMLFFMLSLTAIAPLLGFEGLFAVVTNLANQDKYLLIILILLGLLTIAASFASIIRIMYFMIRKTDYDRPDYGIYLYLAIIVGLNIIMMLHPEILTDNAILMLNSMRF